MTNVSAQDFSAAIEDKRIVILYPQTAYRTVFLSYLFQLDGHNLIYFRLKSHNTTISQMINSLLDEVGADFSTAYHNHLQSSATPHQARALAATLVDYAPQTILYIDELDRLTLDETYHEFFATLAEHLSKQTKLVINARSLTAEPWRHLVLQEQAVVLGTERRASQLMFSPQEIEKPQLEIYAFGRGHAIVNGLPVKNWDGALPRNLFFYFIDRDLVTRDEIFKEFWPDLRVKEATNVFHVTKRKISERLSDNVQGDGNYELTTYSTGFYRPANKIVRHYDVKEFEEAVDKASMTFNEAHQAVLYRRAVDLYRAPFLSSVDMPWVVERREKLKRLLLEALIGLARIHKAADRHEEALGYFMRAIHETPLREDIHREVMSLYQELGYRDEAIKQYHQLETLLQDLLGVGPSVETQSLLDTIEA